MTDAPGRRVSAATAALTPLRDGPLPAHYEPIEGGVRTRLEDAGLSISAFSVSSRRSRLGGEDRGQAQRQHGGHREGQRDADQDRQQGEEAEPSGR